MKFATVSKSVVMGLAVLLASSAFAATKGNVQLHDLTTINGTQLQPGEYKVQWEGTGPNVEVSFMKGKNVVAKTSGHLVDLPSASSNDAAVVTKNTDGTSALEGVRFEGKKFALELGQASDGMSAGSSK